MSAQHAADIPPLTRGTPETPSGPQVRPILLGVLMAMFLAALDQTIVATALPRIGQELRDIEHLPWVVTAYLLSSTAVTPLYGKLSDIHGRRILLLAGIWLFLAGSIACALAPNMLALILARALQGLGGGGLLSLAQTIIGDVVPPRDRGRYQVYFASVFVVASLLGPVLGGYFAEHLHWSFIFWINIPLGIMALQMTNSRLKALPRHDRRHSLDYVGAILMVCATSLLMLALSWGGIRFPWLSGEIVALCAASLALWLAFTARLLTAAEPFIPLNLFAHPVVTSGTISACFVMGTFIGLTIYAPIYFQSVLGLSESSSGLALIPLMIGTVTGATISGRSMVVVRHYKRLPLFFLLTSVAALLLLALYPIALPLWAIEVCFATTSIGLGTVLPVTTVAIQNAVPMHQLGTATANVNFFRQLGAAIGVAVFGAILLGGFAAGTAPIGMNPARLAPAEAARLAEQFRWVFIAAAIGVMLALASLAAMRELPLRGRAVEAAAAAIAD